MSKATQEIWFENPYVGQRSCIVTLPSETGGRQFVLDYGVITADGLTKPAPDERHV